MKRRAPLRCSSCLRWSSAVAVLIGDNGRQGAETAQGKSRLGSSGEDPERRQHCRSPEVRATATRPSCPVLMRSRRLRASSPARGIRMRPARRVRARPSRARARRRRGPRPARRQRPARSRSGARESARSPSRARRAVPPKTAGPAPPLQRIGPLGDRAAACPCPPVPRSWARTSATRASSPRIRWAQSARRQVLVYVNGWMRVFDKSGNRNPGDLDVSDSTFWDSELPTGVEPTDPGVEYDRLAGRWIVSAISVREQQQPGHARGQRRLHDHRREQLHLLLLHRVQPAPDHHSPTIRSWGSTRMRSTSASTRSPRSAARSPAPAST